MPDDKAWWFWPAVYAGLRVIRTESPAVILTTGPPHSTHLVGVALSRLTGVPLVLDFRDPWARTPWGPRKDDPLAQKIVVRLERAAVRTAVRVILNTARLRDDFSSHYGADTSRRFEVIPNGYDPDLLDRVKILLSEHRPEVANRELSVVHVGSLYKGRDPVPVLEAISLLRRQGVPITFRQVGSCARSFSPEREVQRLGLNGAATFESAVPHDVALSRTAMADILLAIQPGTHLQVPGKIFEMMLFGKPIIGITDEGATSDLLSDYRLGYAVRAGDVEGLALAIRRAMDDASNRNLPDRKEAMAHFDGRRLTGELARIFDEIA
jgi:glycosyltransferase involved in cell wall biosynthesis